MINNINNNTTSNTTIENPYALILYYSRYGATRSMAQQIARGLESVSVTARLRTVPNLIPQLEALEASTFPEHKSHYTEKQGPKHAEQTEQTEQIKATKQEHHPYVTKEDLQNAQALILGSPTRFGNMAAPLKYFLDSTSDLWLSGSLVNKPAAVFTSSSSMHGGQESTLLSMMLPLIHHGAYIVGIPYSEAALSATQSGGTPYGASHVAGVQSNLPLTKDEKVLCFALGRRLGNLVNQLQK